MAKQDLVQYLEAGAGLSASDRRRVVTYKAGATIVVGDALSIMVSKTADGDKALYVVPLDFDAVSTDFFIGVAVTAASAEERVDVCVGGICEAKVSTSTVAGSHLVSGSTAGELALWTDSDLDGYAGFVAAEFPRQLCARALEADAAGVATVFVFSQI